MANLEQLAQRLQSESEPERLAAVTDRLRPVGNVAAVKGRRRQSGWRAVGRLTELSCCACQGVCGCAVVCAVSDYISSCEM